MPGTVALPVKEPDPEFDARMPDINTWWSIGTWNSPSASPSREV